MSTSGANKTSDLFTDIAVPNHDVTDTIQIFITHQSYGYGILDARQATFFINYFIYETDLCCGLPIRDWIVYAEYIKCA